MSFSGMIMIAVIVESIWETIKMTRNDRFNWDRIGAIIVGVLIAFGIGADVFDILGFPFRIPYLGIVLTGLLISRGANFIHDLLKRIGSGERPEKKSI